MMLDRFSIGVGDRFAHQAKAQLEACVLAGKAGVEVIPVWNKSNREHTIIGSEPASARAAADAAVKALGWTNQYFCDADHINLNTVERFLAPCDFYTIDVADYIGKPAQQSDIDSFVARHSDLLGEIRLEGVAQNLEITPELLKQTAAKFLFAVQEAGKVYRKIEGAKGAGNFLNLTLAVSRQLVGVEIKIDGQIDFARCFAVWRERVVRCPFLAIRSISSGCARR